MPAVRNHLDIPYGLKLGDRMDPATANVIAKIRDLLGEYKRGNQHAFTMARELDNFAALIGQCEPVLPPRRLDWEGADSDKWIPQTK